ncbi:MAG: hypothetical protein ABIN95_11430 [Mucilaginibacter sp.]
MAAAISCNPVLPDDIAKIDSVANDSTCNGINVAKEWNHLAYTTMEPGNIFTIDNSGNTIITGQVFENNVDLDPDSASVVNINGLFIQKTDPSGKFLWASQIYSPTRAPIGTPLQIKTDAADNIYLAWAIWEMSRMKFQVSKYSASGTLLWQTSLQPGTNQESRIQIAIDQSENVYALDGILLHKIDINGDILFSNQIGQQNITWRTWNMMDVGPSGNLYLSGKIWGVADVDYGPGTHIIGDTLKWTKYVAKYSPACDFISATITTSQTPVNQYARIDENPLGIDANENIFVFNTNYYANSLDDGARLIKINANGDILFNISVDYADLEGFRVSPTGSFYIFKGSPLDMHISKYSNEGIFLASAKVTPELVPGIQQIVTGQFYTDHTDNIYTSNTIIPLLYTDPKGVIISKFKPCN